MKKSGIILLCILGLALVVKVAWGIAYPSATWRYKMTVEVETPEGIKTGSAVREVGAHVGLRLSPHAGGSASVLKGEAVVIDLGERGVVFALMKGPKLGVDYGASLPFYAFPWKKGGLTPEGIRHYARLKAGSKKLDIEWYPQMVRFRDINDPKTVENLLEMRSCTQQDGVPDWQYAACLKKDRFEEAFGEGVRLKSVVIEMTDEDVTWEIDKYLEWLSALKGGYLHGGETQRGAPLGLYGGNFQTGR